MLHQALRLIRVFHDMPQRKLADRLAIAPSYLSEIETGKKEPTLRILEGYAAEFRMPISSILFFSERLQDGTPAERARIAISRKVLTLLDFIAARSGAG